MNNKSGFTLVELLAVIVILALIVAVAVPSTMSISNKIKKNMFCSKIDFIENAAKLYGEDRRDELSYGSKDIKVLDLVNNNYLKKDNKNAPYIENPQDKSKSLDDMLIEIGLKNKRVSVNFNEEIIGLCGKDTVTFDSSYYPDYPDYPDEPDDLDPSEINVRIVSTNSKYSIEPDRNYAYVKDAANFEILKGFAIEGNCPSCTLEIVNNKIVAKYKNTILDNTSINLVGVVFSDSYNITDDNSLVVKENDIEIFLNGVECRNCSTYLEKNGVSYHSGTFEKGDSYTLVITHTASDFNDYKFYIRIYNE